jgi:hypothetical protein
VCRRIPFAFADRIGLYTWYRVIPWTIHVKWIAPSSSYYTRPLSTRRLDLVLLLQRKGGSSSQTSEHQGSRQVDGVGGAGKVGGRRGRSSRSGTARAAGSTTGNTAGNTAGGAGWGGSSHGCAGAVAVRGKGGLLLKVGAGQARGVGVVDDKRTAAEEGLAVLAGGGPDVGVGGSERVRGDLAMLAAQVTDLAGVGSRRVTGRGLSTAEGIQVSLGRSAVAVNGGSSVEVVACGRWLVGLCSFMKPRRKTDAYRKDRPPWGGSQSGR